jgi:hypothetical protein
VCSKLSNFRTPISLSPEQSTLVVFIFFLQEGQVSEAEILKLKLEQNQRERRLQMELDATKTHNPQWFAKTNEKTNTWTFNEDYWSKRSNAFGFSQLDLMELW